MRCIRFVSLAGACMVFSTVTATEIVYRPINPSFGGDPLNGPNLLNSAIQQNRFTDPSTGTFGSAGGFGGSSSFSPVQQFNDTLQRSILSRIASSVSGNLFDSSGRLIPGVVDTADFRITIVGLGGGVLEITTLDKVTGQSATFQVSQ